MAGNGDMAHAVASPQNVAEAEELIKRLYKPGHPVLIANVNDQLQQLQKSEHGWKLADELMGSNDLHVRFYAALTFTVKLNNEGPSLDTETAQTVHQRLMYWTVRLIQQGETNMVLKKMCSTLATYFIRSPTLWQRPLLHLAACLQQGDAVNEPSVDDSARAIAGILPSLPAQQLVALMWFAATLAEDVGKVDSNTPANVRIHAQMESIVKEANAALAFCFSQSDASTEMNLNREAIGCYGSWINYAQPLWPRKPEALQYLRELIPTALICIYGEGTDEDALEMFCDILESYTSFFEPRHMELIAKIINERVRPILENAVAAKDADGESFGRFVVAYGCANIKQVIEDYSDSKESGTVVDLVLSFLTSDGYPGDDLFLAFGSIEFWNTYIEYVNDEVFSADLDAEPSRWERDARQVARRVVELLWRKLWTPPSEVVKDWRDEEREMFKEYRQDASDLMLSIFVLLRNEMLQQIISLTLASLQEQQWRGVEAGLFCLNNVAENVMEDQESEDSMAPVFRSGLFRGVADFSQPIPAQARRTAVDMLGSYGPYIERHPEFLPDTVTFLFTALEKGGLANVAAKSIAALCSACRANLTGHLPGFLSQYQRFLESPTCETYTKEKVIGAIAAIIQALRPESAKTEPLLALLEHVHKDIASAKQHAANGDQEMTELVGVSALECLASIGKGLQVPDDVPVVLDAETPMNGANFWASEQGQAVQQSIMNCFSVLQVVGGYGEAVEAVCKVLRYGFTETEPGPFVLPASVTVSFVQECSVSTPQLDSVLGTVCTLITQHSHDNTGRIDNEVAAICDSVIAFMQALGHPSQDPGVAMGCIDALNRMMPNYCQVLFGRLNPPVIDFTLDAINGNNTFTKRSACDFWSKMIKPQASTISDEVRQRLKDIMSAYGPKLANAIICQIGGNALRSDLEFVCEPLKALLLHQPGVQGWLQQALLGETFPAVAPHVGHEQRNLFLRQVLATRGDGNRIKPLVRQFWAACRGTVTSYGS